MRPQDITLTGTATYYAIWEKMPEIILNEKTVVPYDEASAGNVWYYFQPEEDGWYVFDFHSTGEKNSYATVYAGTTFETELFYWERGNEAPVEQLDGGSVYGVYFSLGDGTTELAVTKLTNYVTLDGNGGALESGETVVESAFQDGETLSKILSRIGSFYRDGYSSRGHWSTSPDGKDSQRAYDIVLEAGKTYYAVWGKNISITVNGNGAKTYDGNKETAKLDVAEGYPLSWYQYDGYGLFKPPVGKAFAGWALTPDAEEPDMEAIIKEGMTVYAVWQTKFFQVDLLANGGYFSTETEISFEAGGYAGEKLSILPSDTPTSFTKGKVFDGWYYDVNCTVPIGVSLSEFRPTDYTMLYAGYKDDGTMVTNITMSKTAKVLIGKTKTLKATVAPKTAKNKTLSWSSSNKKIATVSADGVVKGVGVGTAIITAKAKDGSGVKASCKVVVRQPVTRIAISKTQVSIKKGKSTTLKAVAKPTSAYNREVTWTSSNKKVATVTQKGVVKGVGKGTAIITVKAKDGSGTTVTCKVVVK